jgi:hypothetical protein
MEVGGQTGANFPESDQTSWEPFWTTIQSLKFPGNNKAEGTGSQAVVHFGTLISWSDAHAWRKWVDELPMTWCHAIVYMITEALDAALHLSWCPEKATVVVEDVRARLSVLKSCLFLLIKLARCEHFLSSTILALDDRK